MPLNKETKYITLHSFLFLFSLPKKEKSFPMCLCMGEFFFTCVHIYTFFSSYSVYNALFFTFSFLFSSSFLT